MVEVRIFGALWEHLASRVELDLEGQAVTVADLLSHLGIDPSAVGLVTANGRQSRPGDPVPAEGRVCIFPPMFGG